MDPKGVTPVALRCEYLKNPRGIDQMVPRLMWRIDSGERGQRQTAYRVLVASSLEKINHGEGDLWDSEKVSYGAHYHNDGRIAEYVSPAEPAAILENDGVLVTGDTILDAFDRLEVLESTAEAIINAKSIGQVNPMPGNVIDELRDAFGIEKTGTDIG